MASLLTDTLRFLSSFILDLAFYYFGKETLPHVIFCMVPFMLLDENSSIPVQVHTETSKTT